MVPLTNVLYLCLVLLAAGENVGYTPRMFREGGKYYVAPKGARGGISSATRAEVGNILKGILGNLMNHKAAMPQVAVDIVQKFHLNQNISQNLTDGLQSLYAELNNTSPVQGHGLQSMIADEKELAGSEVRNQAKAVLASVLQHVEYTPRMFREGGKYYVAPKGARGGISSSTRAEVGNILKGILGNLMKSKAALPQMASDIVQRFHLGENRSAELTNGLQSLYAELNNTSPVKAHGLQSMIADEKALAGSEVRNQAKMVLASVLQNVSYQPRKAYHPSRSRGLGISKATKNQVAGILNGILSNLMKHKAALPQVASDIVQKFHLTQNSSADLADGLQSLYTNFNTSSVVASEKMSNTTKGQVQTVLASILADRKLRGSF